MRDAHAAEFLLVELQGMAAHGEAQELELGADLVLEASRSARVRRGSGGLKKARSWPRLCPEDPARASRRSCSRGRRQSSSVRSGSRESKAPTRMRFSATG